MTPNFSLKNGKSMNLVFKLVPYRPRVSRILYSLSELFPGPFPSKFISIMHLYMEAGVGCFSASFVPPLLGKFLVLFVF